MENFKHKEQPTIVEIGPSMLPIYELLREDETLKKIYKGAPYFAIDCDEKELKKFKANGKGEAIIGDLGNMPIKNESADQVWLMNVFGYFEKKPQKQSDGSLVWEIGSYNKVFSELSRITKKNGEIIIGEIYPPARKSVDWLTNENYSNFGFKKEVYKGLETVKIFLEKHGGCEVIIDTIEHNSDVTPFFLVLKKEK